ncbi:MAG: T9SS type A sorting domain-containing protein, partial [Saprospiraceae bacterium]|nr:T9SS type A sorting domain-containing protein [Saprospiraceae bacterium]
QFICDLVSPRIDLSGVTGGVSVRFNQLVRHLNLATGATFRTSVSYSFDDGNTWSDPIEANPDLMVNQASLNNQITIPIPNAAGQANFRIKFTYGQDFYFWVLDDIQLIERGGTDLRANKNFFAIPSDAQVPSGHAGTMRFLHDIQNVGGEAATGVNLNVSVRNPQNMEIYSADKMYGTIGVDSLAENEIFGEFMPPADIGTYNGLYTLSSDSVDIDPSNNQTMFSFNITEDFFAKDLGATRSVAPAADNTFAYGCHYIARQNGFKADFVRMGLIFNDGDRSAVAGRELFIWLYEWNDENGDALSQESERTRRGIGSYTIVGNENYNNALIDVTLDPWTDPSDLVLEAGKEYIVMIEYTDDLAAPAPAFLAAAQNLDYGATVFLQDSIGEPRYAAMLDVGNTGEFSSIGFGYDLVPLAQLHGTQTNSNDDIELADNALTVYPNPVDHNMNVEVDLEEASDITIGMWSMDGKLIFKEDKQNVGSETLRYNVSGLANGEYLLKIFTDEGFKTRTVNVQH